MHGTLIPTPAMIPGVIGVIAAAIRKRKKADALSDDTE